MRLVVDTNIVIASILKESTTRKIILHPLFSFYIPEHAFVEIENHRDELTEKSGLSRHRFNQVLDGVKRKLSIVPAHEFSGHYPAALELMRNIDPDDAPFVALAMSFDNDGIWSNDGHFEEQNIIRVWNTRDLLEELREIEEGTHA
jgi:predicted nucleic acid-binding protein